MCDSLFFKDFHKALLFTLKQMCGKDAIIVIVAPKRGESQEQFLALAQGSFDIEINNCSYFEEVLKDERLNILEIPAD